MRAETEITIRFILSDACFPGALKKTPVGKEATHHQFADVVKKWLRFAPFRQGGSGRRQHYKPPVEFMCPKYHTDTDG